MPPRQPIAIIYDILAVCSLGNNVHKCIPDFVGVYCCVYNQKIDICACVYGYCPVVVIFVSVLTWPGLKVSTYICGVSKSLIFIWNKLRTYIPTMNHTGWYIANRIWNFVYKRAIQFWSLMTFAWDFVHLVLMYQGVWYFLQQNLQSRERYS